MNNLKQEENKYFAVVTKVEECKDNDEEITIFFDVYINGNVESFSYTFTKIFSRGKLVFENFIVASSCYYAYTVGNLALSISRCLYLIFNEENSQIIDFAYIPDDEYNEDEMNEIFHNSLFSTDVTIPESLKSYNIMPYCENGFQENENYIGYIKDVNVYISDNKDYKFKFTVNVFNGYKIQEFDYYINSILGNGYIVLCDRYHIEPIIYMDNYKKMKEYLSENILYKPIRLGLYVNKAEKMYVQWIDSLTIDEEEQYERLIKEFIAYDDESEPFFTSCI